jgi:hypothetical protein
MSEIKTGGVSHYLAPNICISTELWIFRYWFDRILLVNVLILCVIYKLCVIFN